MKSFYMRCLVFFLFINKCVGQPENVPVFHLDNLPAPGALLDKGWKLQEGDNLDYAQPQFDDSKWISINPAKDIHEIPQLWNNNIVWFRLHFTADSSVISQQLALIILQAGASEMYLNGKLLYRFGKVSREPKEIIAYNPLAETVSFPLISGTEQVFAVRYVLQPNLFYTEIFSRGNPALQIEVNNINRAMKQYQHRSTGLSNSIVFRIGAFVILAILHLAFYLYYPPQKANLYFCWFALFVLANEIVQINSPHEVKYIFYYSNLVFGFYQLSTFFLLTALYFLLNQKKGWIYWTLLVLIIIGIVLNLWSFNFSVFIISNLLILEVVRIAFIALNNKQRGAWIIVSGAISYFVFYLIFVLGVPFNYMNNPISQNYTIGDLTYNLQFLSIPVATSIYLALDFAFTSRSLEQKLVEVNTLSREKQQILANQNQLLEQQVTERTAALNQSLEQLKSAQSQLIQSEKMASLGELTAGIAHEIQNPLNFVNNFSDVNIELIEDLKSELATGNGQEATAIANDIKENEQKINHHGKRADAIVKGMLQHSRTSTGKKEPTDINALADEYLRLAYHGLRAKDKDFNANFKTSFDESIGKIEVVQQDIGRVLLNLYNNAFYAVHEKKKQLNGTFEPIVEVSTKKVDNKVEISVRDNGSGIPAKNVEKIFQPFFTTKPTGQGTGLGLSLSYDIIKAHEGELKVETKEGEGAEFSVHLPLK